jgi:hypothetical protein
MAQNQSFSGVSGKRDLQEALNAAIEDASRQLSQGGADIQVKWRLDSIQGTEGGFVGLKELTVTISAGRP